MVETPTTITRQSVGAPSGGMPRIPRSNISSGIEAIGKTVGEGLVGFFEVRGNEKKAKWAFKFRNTLNNLAITKNRLEVANERDRLIKEAGPDGSGILSQMDMRQAQQMKPEFVLNRRRDQFSGDTLVYDENNQIVARIPAKESAEKGIVENALNRIQNGTPSGLRALQDAFPRTSETLETQLINPHVGDPEKHKKAQAAALELSVELDRVSTTIQQAIDLTIMRTGTEYSTLDIKARDKVNRDRLFVALEGFSLQLEALNRYSQEGVGGPAQIAPISVFNAFKGELQKMLITPEASSAYGGMEEVRRFLDTMETDIDSAAQNAIAFGTTATYAKELKFEKEFFVITRELREEAVRAKWPQPFLEATVNAEGLTALATAKEHLQKSGQPKAASFIADIVTNQLMGRQYDSAIEDLESFLTDKPVESSQIFLAMKLFSDSALSTIDAKRMRRAKAAIVNLLEASKGPDRRISFAKNPDAERVLRELLEMKFNDKKMAVVEPITVVWDKLRKARNP